MKILNAEDDLISRKLLRTTLEHFGHEVVAYTNGEEAWNGFQESSCRVIVSDWLMPKLDGLGLCRKVRAEENQEEDGITLISSSSPRTSRARIPTWRRCKPGLTIFWRNHSTASDQIWMRLRVAERILTYATQISRLESMLPICSYCKKVRDDNNYWQQVESYIGDRTGTSFSHSVCPSCYEEVVKPQLEELRNLNL